MSVTCFHCSKVQPDTASPMAFRETCAHCSADLHVCRNCAFYDTGAYHECRESQAEWVKDKERWNRCEYFKPLVKGAAGESKRDPFAALDDLFKK